MIGIRIIFHLGRAAKHRKKLRIMRKMSRLVQADMQFFIILQRLALMTQLIKRVTMHIEIFQAGILLSFKYIFQMIDARMGAALHAIDLYRVKTRLQIGRMR